MTNKELSQAIRKELKYNGWTSKDISVRVRDSGYDTAVYVTIKNALIRKSEVKALVEKYDEVERDERTFEILAGCNTYVFVDYEYGVVDVAAASLLPTAEMVLNNPEKYSGHKIADNGETEVHITRFDGNDWILSEFKKGQKAITEYRPTFWVKCPQTLAAAMFRFKNLGTIYA